MDAGQVGDLLVFGQFEDEAVGRDTQFGEQRAGMAVHQAGIEQAARGDIEEQAPRQALRGEGTQTGFAAGMFQIGAAPATRRDGKQPVRPVQTTLFRAADQGFVAKNGTQAKIQYGLKHREEQVLAQQPLEFQRFAIHRNIHRSHFQ